MIKKKIFASICVVLVVSLWSLPIFLLGQNPPRAQHREAIKVPRRTTVKKEVKKKSLKPDTLLRSIALYTDLSGVAMTTFSPWGQVELGAKVNLKNRFFPLLEIGMGMANSKNEDTHLHYRTRSPYFKVGMDYNFLAKKSRENRCYVGMRIAYSNYRFDLSGPSIIDPIYGTTTVIDYRGLTGSQLWGELLFGVEAHVWKFIRLGWNVRYKRSIVSKDPLVGNAGYIPGYGPSGQHRLGGSFVITFELPLIHLPEYHEKHKSFR